KGASESGGRQLLEDTLVQRGAIVHNLVCYRRELKTLTAAERRQLAVGVRNGAAVLIGSVETLESLSNNLAREELSLSDVAHLLVPHQRVAGAATSAGVRRVSVVSLQDNKLVETLATPQA
ncbi:MAG: hypothetical protein ACKO15_00330, partial [Burkholderiales bacterium]